MYVHQFVSDVERATPVGVLRGRRVPVGRDDVKELDSSSYYTAFSMRKGQKGFEADHYYGVSLEKSLFVYQK